MILFIIIYLFTYLQIICNVELVQLAITTPGGVFR